MPRDNRLFPERLERGCMRRVKAERLLSHRQIQRFYDSFGRMQDWQGFYEDIATDALLRNGASGQAREIFELGRGTGRFAERLLDEFLPPEARYVGVDLSDTMVAMARKRLARFGPRAEVYRSDGAPQFDFGPGTFDRCVANDVLDLLTSGDIEAVLGEARRILCPGGLPGLTSLTRGFIHVSCGVERVWRALHALHPMLVGGCRPIRLSEWVTEPRWQMRDDAPFSGFGVPSEVLVAERVGSVKKEAM